MQYPQFQAQGWPIGSGIVESANKLVVQARLKGPGMHWERKNVNPMLALRLAVCNDRWAEMWNKALASRLHQSALVPALPPGQSSKALASGSTSSSSVPQVASVPAKPRPCVRPASQRLSPSVRSQTRSLRVNPDAEKNTAQAPVCKSCGAPVVPVRGHRRRQYCSDRCRTRAYRARRKTSSLSLPRPVRSKHEAHRKLPHAPIPCSHSHCPLPQPFVKAHADWCPCGAPVVEVPGRGHRPRLYCSARCRMRALRWRRAEHGFHQPSPEPQPVSFFGEA